MLVYVVISGLALLCYSGLLALVARYGWHGNRSRELFLLYLLDMVFLQVSYLLLSLADSAQAALVWYTFNILLSAGQAVIYFFFATTFLGLKAPRKGIQAVIFVWLLAVMAAAFLFPGFMFTHIYRHAVTGLFIPELTLWGVLLLLPITVFWGLTVFSLAKNYRSARSPLQRVRIQYVLLSILVVWAGLFANAAPALRPYPVDVVANIVGAFLIAYAILRYQLLDMSIVIRRNLSYVVSILFIGTGYFTTLLVSTRFFQHLTVWQLLLISFATAIVGVILTRPLVERIQFWIDAVFFRERYGGALMIQRLSRTATSVLDLEQLAGMILDDLNQTLHVHWVAFFLEQEDVFRLLVQRGTATAADLDLRHDHPLVSWLNAHPTILTADLLDALLAQDGFPQPHIEELKRVDAAMFVPLMARDRLVGILGISAKLSGHGFSQDDELMLSTLANQVAIAVDNARLYAVAQRELAERKRAEVEREKLIAALQAKNAELERFTYTVSHDLKSPLITIKGFLGFLEQDIAAANAERIKADIAFITGAADKMHQLLVELLELSRIGRIVNPPQPVAMSELAAEAAALVAGQLTERRVRVVIMPDMPTVIGDRPRLREVFQNLLSNAAQYMGDQPAPLVEVGCARMTANLCFTSATTALASPRPITKKSSSFLRNLIRRPKVRGLD
ncbi:MAG TPA: GAF domain-containing protein [Anaerolineae bacterium]|nr:GAF domain-containing protein [Anaerolineae bacterium]HQI84553.1 GAF domain-containing protein [Anaerolineae bacterium]